MAFALGGHVCSLQHVVTSMEDAVVCCDGITDEMSDLCHGAFECMFSDVAGMPDAMA